MKQEDQDLLPWANYLLDSQRVAIQNKGADAVIQFFYVYSSPLARRLIEDALGRRVYKRVFERSLSSLSAGNLEKLSQFFSGKGRIEHARALSHKLKGHLRQTIQNVSQIRASVQFDPLWKRVEEIYSETLPFVFDMPTRAITDQGELPEIVPDFERKYFPHVAGDPQKPVSLVWKVIPELIRGSAVFRIFCEPRLHEILRDVMPPDELSKVIAAYFSGAL